MTRPLGSIRARLTLWYVALLAATLIASGVVLYVSVAAPLDLTTPLELLTMHAPANPSAGTDEALRASVGHLLGGVVLVVPLVLVLAVAGGLFLASRALDPIDRMIHTADRIGADGDLQQRMGVPHSSDELGRLAGTLDGMLSRLEGAFRRERQLTTDIAHELRTPLTAVIIQAEVVLAQPRSASDYRQTLERVHADATRLADLVDQMLQLARAEAGQEPLACERVELTELAAQVLNTLRPMSAARGVDVALTAPQAVFLVGDQVRLVQVLLNLVENSLRHVEPAGTVEVTIDRREPFAHVDVRDTGEGIAPEHLARVFDRFYRVDPARDRDHGGAGLGLAISKWIVEAHGGSIEARSEVGVGTTFTVRLPLAADATPSDRNATVKATS